MYPVWWETFHAHLFLIWVLFIKSLALSNKLIPFVNVGSRQGSFLHVLLEGLIRVSISMVVVRVSQDLASGSPHFRLDALSISDSLGVGPHAKDLVCQ